MSKRPKIAKTILRKNKKNSKGEITICYEIKNFKCLYYTKNYQTTKIPQARRSYLQYIEQAKN